MSKTDELLETIADMKLSAEAAIETKHEYNKTRPYRHGGKVI